MDELVFLRETLRRRLLEASEQLEKAAREYDAADPIPKEDLVATLLLAEPLLHDVRNYCEMVVHRMEERAKR